MIDGSGSWLALLVALAASSPLPGALPAATERGVREASADPFGVSWLRAPAPRTTLIRSSTFTMGSTPAEVVDAFIECQREQRGPECDPSFFANEGPVRTVVLSTFLLDRREVTVEEYARCVAAARCRAVPYFEGARRFEHRGLPVTLVAWNDAVDYCAFVGGRLPTEAEFERAARGVAGRKYPWGNLRSSRAANHGRFAWNPADTTDGFAELAPVGSFPEGRTPDGIDDLAGNAAEWVSDRYLPEYSPTDVVNPQGPDVTQGTGARVVRGGSYESAVPFLRGAARVGMDAGTRMPTIGFRCAHDGRRPPP